MRNFKKLLVPIVLSVFVISLNAQTEAGKIIVGGSTSVGFSSMTLKEKSDDGNQTDGKQTDINLSPDAGYFVMDGLAVGLAANVSMSTIKPEGFDYKATSTALVLSPFVKYYYGTEKIKPFATASVGLGSLIYREKTDGTTETEKAGVFGFGAGVGAAMFLNDNAAFEVGIAYNSMSQKAKENNDNNSRDIQSGINLQVGIVIVL